MRAAVIVPVYGQAELMSETVSSLLAQQGAEPFAILLVDDRCADPRTARKAATFAAAHPGEVFYLRTTENAGLSAIRNAGVRQALELWPELEAVAFVDGDDKVFGRYVARGLEALRWHGGQPTADGGRIGWVYDDWHQFGTAANLHSPAPYNALFALAGCQHTPGCFCRADLFREGLWFDEARRGGDAEDWHFWARCHAGGWRGHHQPMLGFRYRRRTGGLAHEGRQAAERNRVLIQKEFPQLYHPDHFLAQEHGPTARHLVLDGGPGGRLGLHGPRLDEEALSALLIRLAQLPTTAAPAQALIFTGAARDDLAAAQLLDWTAWFLEACQGEGAAALTLEPSPTPGAALRATPAQRGPGPKSVVSMPLLTLARALIRGHPPTGLTTPDACRHYALHLPAGGTAAEAPSLETQAARLSAALSTFDQPGHAWHREDVWLPGAARAGLDRLHLGYRAPLADPGARQASLIVVSAQDLTWRAGDLGLAEVAAHLERRDGTPPSLCVMGAELPGTAVADLRLRSVFLLPAAERRVEPEGLLAAFGTVASLDCADIVPAMNAVRRFGCRTMAILPRDDLGRSNLAQALLKSFKAFQSVVLRAESQRAHVLGLGCAREIVSREMIQPAWTRDRDVA